MPFCWSLCSFNYPMGNGATISIICVLLMSSSVNFSENIVIHMKYNKKLKPNITHLSKSPLTFGWETSGNTGCFFS